MARLVVSLFLGWFGVVGLGAEDVLSVDAMWLKGETFTPDRTFNLPSVPARKPWRVAVLFPYLQDPVFLAAAYGIDEQARELGVVVSLYLAGGYGSGDQDRQLRQLASQHSVDAILLAATDDGKLKTALEAVQAAGIPVVAVLNNVNSNAVVAKVVSSTEDMGRRAGEQVMRLAAGRDIKVAFIPGPHDEGWSQTMYEGNLRAIRAAQGRTQKVTLVEPIWTAMTTEALANAVRTAGASGKPDFVISNGPAAAIAARRNGEIQGPQIVSNYLIPEVLQAIRRGTIAAASNAKPVEQGRAAIRLVTGILNGLRVGKELPFWVSVPTESITIRESSRPAEQFFGPENYRPRVIAGSAL